MWRTGVNKERRKPKCCHILTWNKSAWDKSRKIMVEYWRHFFNEEIQQRRRLSGSKMLILYQRRWRIIYTVAVTISFWCIWWDIIFKRWSRSTRRKGDNHYLVNSAYFLLIRISFSKFSLNIFIKMCSLRQQSEFVNDHSCLSTLTICFSPKCCFQSR